MKIIALSNIKHDGKSYEMGDQLPPMKQAQLASLEEAKVVKVGNSKPATKLSKPVSKPVSEKKVDKKDPKVEVPNIVPQKNMSKEKLRGIGMSRGLEIDKTITRDEIFTIVDADVKERGELDVTEIKAK